MRFAHGWGCRKSFHHKTSKFVSGPKGQVVNVSPRGCLFQELAGVKNTVIRLKVSVTINLPTNFHSGSIADEASSAAVGRDEQKTRYRVNSVVDKQMIDLLIKPNDRLSFSKAST